MKVLLTGGGTGGHIYPALAVAEKIRQREPEAELLFVGTESGIEMRLVPEHGYRIETVPARAIEVDGGIAGRVKGGMKAALGMRSGIKAARRILKAFRPDAVVGTGGYVSFPVMMAAKSLKIPCLIHEQNAYPGRSNLILSRFANRIMLGFREAGPIFHAEEKTVFTGNPIRAMFLGVSREEAREALKIGMDDYVVFSFGGSMGSEEINSVASAYMKRIAGQEGKVLLFGAGSEYVEEIKAQARAAGIAEDGNIRILPYILDMQYYIAASDLVVCRAGALSIAETCVLGKPAIYIPLSWSVNDHQRLNAESVAERGGAMVVDERGMDPEEVADAIEVLGWDRERLEQMSAASLACSVPDAADRIYEVIKDIHERRAI